VVELVAQSSDLVLGGCIYCRGHPFGFRGTAVFFWR
jgi:hypothetical protein